MVKYVGLTDLGLPLAEERHARAIVDRHMHRIHALTDDVIDARVRIKRVWKGGGTARFEISVGLLTNGGPRYAASSSWTLSTALHNAFESVENQLLSRREERHIGGHADHWRYADQVVLQ